jgi:hypothetical protein
MEIIVKETSVEMSQRKYEGYLKWCDIVQWGRENPLSFIEKFFGIRFLDFQKYVLLNSWTTPYVLWCMSRNSGKTFLGSPLIMAKSMLFPNHATYILAGTAQQSQNMFKKIEQTAKKEIESLTTLTDIFLGELVKTNSQSDGFVHDKSSYSCQLFNGSTITSLSGAYDRNRGFRSNLNFYDESGFSPSELFTATDPFLTQNSSFKMGVETSTTATDKLSPINIPNQRILASSASSVDTHFFELYKEYATQMFLGNKDYFVADINCDMVLRPTSFGVSVDPLLTQETINLEMRRNPEKAMREYHNIFTKDGGDMQAIKRAVIMRNCVKYLPIYVNDDKSHYVLAYDPARSYDNSVVTIGKVYQDEKVGYKMQIVNCVSFSDLSKAKKTPMRTPEQVDHLKQLILDYNGKQAADYENIESLLIDSGSGGAGVTIADYFMEDWFDKTGVQHKGLIDTVESSEEVYNFPNAVDKIKLMSPTKWKTLMFDALIEMLGLDLINFPLEYDGKDIFVTQDENGEDKIHMLTDDEKLSFVQIDLLKEELANIYRYDSTNGNHRYNLAVEKENKMHDDRAYTAAMLGWYLQQLRRENIVNPQKAESDDYELLKGFAELFG